LMLRKLAWFTAILLALVFWFSWGAIVYRDQRGLPGLYTFSIENPWTLRDCREGPGMCSRVIEYRFTMLEGVMGFRLYTPTCSKVEARVVSLWNDGYTVASWVFEGGVNVVENVTIRFPGAYAFLLKATPEGSSCDRPRPGTLSIYWESSFEARLRFILLSLAIALTVLSILPIVGAGVWRWRWRP